ncbi:MAG: hypothetical protein LBC77_08205 [Spirochaetaceae bacterium]|jgi:predicted small integral membrane protein|nr:hypothetical protein [Spirochaetaceae bacterium]
MDEIKYYYNREERLAKASPRVRALYEDMPKRRFALFSSLTDSKPKAAMFISIVVMCLLILFVTYLQPSGGTSLSGNELSAEVTRSAGISFIVLEKSAVSAAAWTGIAKVTVMAGEGDNTRIASRELVFTKEKKEEFRWSVPFEGRELLVLVQAAGKSASITALSQ